MWFETIGFAAQRFHTHNRALPRLGGVAKILSWLIFEEWRYKSQRGPKTRIADIDLPTKPLWVSNGRLRFACNESNWLQVRTIHCQTRDLSTPSTRTSELRSALNKENRSTKRQLRVSLLCWNQASVHTRDAK